MDELIAAFDAFVQEHKRCGEGWRRWRELIGEGALLEGQLEAWSLAEYDANMAAPASR